MSSEPSQLLRTALAIIEGYNTWTIDAILAPRAPDCTHQVHPTRLGRPLLKNNDYRAYFSAFIPHFKNFHVEILDVFEDQRNNKVALHIKSSAETALGPYKNEYVLMLQMTGDQRQVASVKEFVDSGYSEEFLGKLAGKVREGAEANL